MIAYEVKAYPMQTHDDRVTDGEPFLVECSECKVIGMFPEQEVDAVCVEHLRSHGVDVSGFR